LDDFAVDLPAVFVVDTAEEEVGECFFTPPHTTGKASDDFSLLSKQKKGVDSRNNDS
jgi:hypothetical protein